MATAERSTRTVPEEVTVVTLNALEVGALLDVLAESDNPVLDRLYESLGKPAADLKVGDRVLDDSGEVWCHIRPFEEEEEIMAEFKPGDRVSDPSGEEYTISYGPYVGPEGETYLIADSREVRYPVRRVLLSPIPPEDPRVDVAKESLFAVVADPNRRDLYARTVLAALDAMPQEKPAPRRVRDRDGGVWEEQADESWLCPPWYSATDREDLAVRYGPLTDV